MASRVASEPGACTTPTSLRGSPQPARDSDAPPAASPISVAIDDVTEVVLREEGEAGGARSGRPRRQAAAQISYMAGGRVPPQDDTKERALKAIRCWYHPDTDRTTLRTKADWAKEFGIDRPRFTYWERRMGEETLDAIKRGVVPLPDRPPSASGEQRSYARSSASVTGAPSAAKLGTLHGYDLDALKAQLAEACTRMGDSRPYGAKGTRGMYREGVKWAAVEMVKGRLAMDGRRASEVLGAVGVSISYWPLNAAAMGAKAAAEAEKKD